MSERDLAARSIAAVTGSVTDIETTADPVTGGVHSYIHIDPNRVIFGSLPGGPLVLREIGGRLGGQTEWLFGSPEYRVGEDVLVFLSQNSDGTLHTTGMSMGKFTLQLDVQGGQTATRRLGEGAALFDLQHGAVVTNPAPEAYDPQVLLDTVSAMAAAAPARPQAPAVQMTPPELASAAVREAQEAFTYLSNASRWFEPDDGQPIPYLIDPTGDVGIGGPTSRAAVDDALAAWTNVPTASVTLTDGGALAQPISFAGCTGGNRIVFNDPFDEITDPIDCGGVLAVGGFCASSEMRTVNGTDFQRIRVGKVMFNNGWSQCPGWDRCNLAEVATHELGHTLGFGHSTDPTATMYASAHFDGRCASLGADDIAGVNFVYPALVVTLMPTPTATPMPATPTLPSTVTPTPSRTLAPTLLLATATATRTLPAATATVTRTLAAATATGSATPARTATGTTAPSLTDTVPPTSTSTPTLPIGHSVRGQVHYYSTNEGVPNVTVNLSGATQHAAQTSSAGDYAFDDVPAGAWELAATKAGDFGAGITPLDAAYVLQAVAQLRTLDSTQMLACDTTGDGTVSALDAARILQFSVGMLDRLPVAQACGSDWTFVPDPAPMQQQSVVNPTIAGGACDGGKIMLQDLLDEAPDQNFRAVLFGDCTGNWAGTDSAAVAADSVPARRVRLGRPTMDGALAHVPVFVRSATPYNSLDLQVAYDPTRLNPSRVTFQRPTNSGLTSMNAPQPGLLRVAMASGQAITRRRGMLLTIEFTVAPTTTDPGAMQALSASIDELPAAIVGGAAAASRR